MNKSKLLLLVRANWPLLVILGLAVFLRFYQLEEFLHFANDEARDAYVVKEMIERDFIRLLGPPTTIGNFYLGPFFYYFLAPFYLIFNLAPVAGGWAVAALDIITVGLIYFFTKKHFSTLTARLAILLYVTSFWLNIYERWGWNPNVLPFFTILTLWLTSQVFFSKKYRLIGIISLAAVVALAGQAHAQGLWLLPLVLLLFIISKRAALLKKNVVRRNLLYAGLFGLIYLLVNLPLIIFEFQTGGQNSRAVINWILTVRESISWLDRIEQGLGDFIQFTSQLVLNKEAIGFVLLLFLLPSSYFIWRQHSCLKGLIWSTQSRQLWALRAILFLFGLVLSSFFLTAEKKYFHFFLLLAPVIFIYLGFLFAQVYRRWGWWSRTLVLALVVFLVSANLLNTVTYWCNLKAGTQTGEFDLPLRDMQAATNYIVANSCAQARVKAVGVEDEQQAFQYLFARAGRNVIWIEDCGGYEFVITRNLQEDGQRFGRLRLLEENK
ncbi:glycosyltransferase family 39 protein [Patescibacteria group bacterium]|nr:glycosyltransferase family 39 protein [Patescibacteria group bacterium]